MLRFPCRSMRSISRAGIPVAANASARPSSVSSRTACGCRLMPTPSGSRARTASTTSTSAPAACRLSADVRPALPAPTTRTFNSGGGYGVVAHQAPDLRAQVHELRHLAGLDAVADAWQAHAEVGHHPARRPTHDEDAVADEDAHDEDEGDEEEQQVAGGVRAQQQVLQVLARLRVHR